MDYCHIEELEVFDLELAEKIKSSSPTEKSPLAIPPFVYALRRSGHVMRVSIKDYELGGFRHDLTESPKHAERIILSEKQQTIPLYIQEEEENVV